MNCMKEKIISIILIVFLLAGISFFIFYNHHPFLKTDNQYFNNIAVNGTIYGAFDPPPIELKQYSGHIRLAHYKGIAIIQNYTANFDITLKYCDFNGTIMDGYVKGSDFKGHIEGNMTNCHITGTYTNESIKEEYKYICYLRIIGIVLGIIGIFFCFYLKKNITKSL